MNILLACASYESYTGSEIYFYELSTALRDLGHSVTITSKIGPSNDMVEKSQGIMCCNLMDIDMSVIYDRVLFSHGQMTWERIKDIKCEKFINIIHSEVLSLEQPVIDPRVHSYIGIRPSIVSFVNNIIKEGKTHLIYNPFDFTRFNKDMISDKKQHRTVLFPGSIDYLRIKPVRYLLEQSDKQNYKIIHVGRVDYNVVHKNFKSYEPVWNIETYYKRCDIVAGIFLGRTTIEGLLCGKRALQFDVDQKGNIHQVYWHHEDNIDKFNKLKVAENILNI